MIESRMGADQEAAEGASGGTDRFANVGALSALAATALSACGGGDSDEGSGPAVALSSSASASIAGMTDVADPLFAGLAQAPIAYELPTFAYPSPTTDSDASRFLQQAQFSSTVAEIAALRAAGTYSAWLLDQFDKPLGQTGWQWLESRGYGRNDLHHYHTESYPADFMVWNQLMTAPDAMRKRMALALSEFFVVSLNGMEFNWRSHAMASWWDMLVRQSFGNFRQLLTAVALHPAMGWYLNSKGNQKPDAATGRQPDENFARELMQLFTIGLYQLNADGTDKLDANGQRIETYTQADVSQLAHVFTGYDFDYSDGVRLTPPGQNSDSPYTIESKAFARKRMAFNPALHSTETVQFLGITLPPNADGGALNPRFTRALNRLFNHPNVGPFFGRQMIQRLVTSNPSPAYVARVAGVFNNNGAGVRGDLRAVWAAILLDDEARAPEVIADQAWGKVRESMLRIVQWSRTFGATSLAGSWKINDTSSVEWSLGQSPLRSPSVFNYYRPGFVPPGTYMARAKATAPEFQTVNETTVGAYLNFISYVVGRGIYVYTPSVPEMDYLDWSPDIVPSYASELPLAPFPVRLVDHLILVMCAGKCSVATRNTIINALKATTVTAASPRAEKLDRIAGAVYLIMASPDYLIQR